MAPKRKAGQSTVAKVAAAPSRETRSAARITRSSAKNSSVNFIELPDTRKIKKSTNKKQKIAEVKGKGKAIAKEDSASEDGKDEEEASENVLEDSSKPVVIIEHWYFSLFFIPFLSFSYFRLNAQTMWKKMLLSLLQYYDYYAIFITVLPCLI
jgi:hypothetical protein